MRALKTLGRMVLCAVVLLLAGAPSVAQEKPDTGVARGFEVLRDFYDARGLETFWFDDGRLTAKARRLPEILETAGRHGLDPAAFGVDRMRALIDGRDLPVTPQDWEKEDMAWTYGLWLYASELAGAPLDAETLAGVMQGDIEDNLRALTPGGELYKTLEDRLEKLDRQIASGEVPAKLDFGRRSLKPGMNSPAVPALRTRLEKYGAAPAAPEVADLYDDSLVTAVQAYQTAHGLKDDGSIGLETLRLLNRTPQEERLQIMANMQRLREPQRRYREPRRIEVSIARYWLTAYDEGRQVLEMPVVVGKPTRQTISFRAEITGVRLNPTWTAPATIRKEDFIPMLMKDPANLAKKHGVKVVQEGKTVNPVGVDWSKVPARELAQLKFWTPAGDSNPLGFYRVIMPNPYDIYLHDTNHRDLFANSMRAQSSGCVRVSEPAKLADFILSFKSGWDPQKTKRIVKSGRTGDVIMENKIPIYLDYMTVWQDIHGQLVLGPDIYGLDKPRYDGLVKTVLTTQRNTQRILDRASEIFTPKLQEAQHRESVLAQSTN